MTTDGMKAIFTVTMANGAQRVHQLNLPNDEKLIAAWLAVFTTQFRNAYVLGKSKAVMLTDPLTLYNVDHVASISMSFINAGEYEKLIEQLTKDVPRQMGFHK